MKSSRKQFWKTENAGYRLAKRRILSWKLRLISDITLGTAMMGIVLMVFQVELVLTGISSSNDPPTFFLKLAISASTALLLVFLVWYHKTDIELQMNDNFVDSWLLVMTPKRLIVPCFELLACAIHPPPHGIIYVAESLQSTEELFGNREEEGEAVELGRQDGQFPYEDVISVDIYLSILMFLRGFLICRAVVLHNKLCTDASMQSLGAMNRIRRFTFSFIFRSMMLVNPVRVLICLILVVLITASWTLRACDPSHFSLPSSLWLILITFLTVGYGDLVPRSYCGQLVAIFTGFFGIGCMALVVAVLTQKLEMSTAERYVHNFVMTVQLQSSYKVAAANIIRCAWLLHRARSNNGADSRMSYYHHRYLMAALHIFRQIKQQKRLVSDGSISLIDLCNGQRTITLALGKLESRLSGIEKSALESLARLENIQQQLANLERLTHLPY